MSKRGQEYNNYNSGGKKKSQQLRDERFDKEVLDAISKDEMTKKRFLIFKKSKIDDGKLKKFVENKYDIIISEKSARILSTLGK